MIDWNTAEAVPGTGEDSPSSEGALSFFHHTAGGLPPRKFALVATRSEGYVVQDESESGNEVDDSHAMLWVRWDWSRLQNYSRVRPHGHHVMPVGDPVYYLAADYLKEAIGESSHLFVASRAEEWEAMLQKAITQMDLFAYSSYEELLRSSASLSYSYEGWPTGDSVFPADRLRKEIESLKKGMSKSHDSDMKIPTDEAFTDALEFISRLDLNACPMPEIKLIGDGEINFSWERGDDNLQIDLGFYGTGKYSCFARRDGHVPVHVDDVPASAGLHEDIQALF